MENSDPNPSGEPTRVHSRHRDCGGDTADHSGAEDSHDHHSHADGGHSHHLPTTFGKAFAIGIALNIFYVVAQVLFGLFAHSLALLSDAGHNLGDVLGLFWSLSTTQAALTVHLIKPQTGGDDDLLESVNQELTERFGISHATVQFERQMPAQCCPSEKRES